MANESVKGKREERKEGPKESERGKMLDEGNELEIYKTPEGKIHIDIVPAE